MKLGYSNTAQLELFADFTKLFRYLVPDEPEAVVFEVDVCLPDGPNIVMKAMTSYGEEVKMISKQWIADGAGLPIEALMGRDECPEN